MKRQGPVDATAAVRRRGWSVSGRPDLHGVFRRARRHSVRVRVLRIAIPLAVAAVVITTGLVAWFNPMRLLDKLPIGGSVVISGTKVMMELPRLSGYTRDARPYEFTAKTAAQDLTQPDRVELKDIHARMEMQDKGIVEMLAAGGIYNSHTERLTLGEKIVLTSTGGYEGHLTEAVVDMNQGHVVSERPVEVTLPNGTLTANRLEVIDSGALIRFEGGVLLILTPAHTDASAASVGAKSP